MTTGKILLDILKVIGIIILVILVLVVVLYIYQYIKTHIKPKCSGNNVFDPTKTYSVVFKVTSFLREHISPLNNIESLNGSITGKKINDTSGTFTISFTEVYTSGKVSSSTLFPDQKYTYTQDNCELNFTLCDDQCVSKNSNYPSSKSVIDYLNTFGISLNNTAYLLDDGNILLRGDWNIIPLQVIGIQSCTPQN